MNLKISKQFGLGLSFFMGIQAITPGLAIAAPNQSIHQQQDALAIEHEVSFNGDFLPDHGFFSQEEVQQLQEHMVSKFSNQTTSIDENDVSTTPFSETQSLALFQSSSQTKIHFLNLDGDTDSILLESNGHFGMVDSGEDNDYPDGSDPNYPLRSGTTINQGFEDQVIAYLKNMGVEKLDFYIGTHAHSDHIGSGDEILNAFPVDTLYLAEYKDEYNFNPVALYDNLYCYDRLIAAAKENGTTIIQDFEDPQIRNFTLGDMEIEIMNYDRETDEHGNIIPVDNDNHNSLAVKVTAAGQVALLGGDMNNLDFDYDETKIADQFEGPIDLLKLCHHGYPGSNSPYFIEKLAPTYAILSGRLINMDQSTFDTIDKTVTTLLSTRWFQNDGAIIANFNPDGIEMTAPDDIIITSRGRDNPELVAYRNGQRIKTPNSWLENNGKFYFIGPNGTLITGRLNIGSDSYFFDVNGEMITGLLNHKDTYYFCGLDGKLVTSGWINDHGTWYFANPDGSLRSGWLIGGDNTWFYLMPDTKKLAIGWFLVDYQWYFSDDDGKMLTKWIKPRDTWYYLDPVNGDMKTGWIKPDGNYYYLDPVNGDMKTGWYLYNHKWYYSSASGAMQTGWIKPDGNYYYLDPINGDMKTGWYLYNHKWYYSSASGAMHTGWIKPDDHYYYLDPVNGDMKTGWYLYNQNWYYSSSSGAMQTGWFKDANGLWYYLNPSSGAMEVGWILVGGHWYYARPNGAIYTNTTVNIGNVKYTFNSSGACINPYQ
ncbi:MAG TPA: MBL fold metallo-hydrolase [Candidatus Merdenecus merdavium]|nr:MBL fold metallo-hydrolase [Candidatus Merdenecus merdavium]